MFLTDETVETDEIKIGLVAVESDASTRFKGEKNVDAKKQNLEADSIEKKEENKPQEEKPEKKVEEDKKAEKTVQVEDKPKTTPKKEKPSLADLKKQISDSQPKTSNGGFSPSADPDGEEVVDRVLQNVTYSNGLVSGSKMGNSEGGLLVDWNDSNRAPEFPQSARASGKHGKIKIKLKVDKAGNVLSYVIVEGSGVPEIDASVERVVGSWRVKLLKKGKPVNGTFYLNYNFNFK
ncbi:energy transducer TonB [Fusobacterium nucleatum subsp. nucleatum ATCC 25586]|uniref:Energy transducer TonB n=2 Tax=Fusobacterium nucleatum TaxID=851 RepID=Q8RI06_FUSNN|nr:TonB protein [Fusobacterium nucleatum subsp. nucleatum ATCC 25586]AVQ15867.1 energy transducer TonB [Fusobacterium nucleatum subsp. nucleatum ATCC 25586]